MSTTITLSNQNSSLLSNLKNTLDSKDDFIYALEQSFPSCSPEYIRVQPSPNVSTPGSSTTFNITRVSKWLDCYLSVTLTSGQANPTTLNPNLVRNYHYPSKTGIALASKIQIQTNGRALYSQTPIDLASHISALPNEQKLRAERALLLFNDNGTIQTGGHVLNYNEEITFHIPLFAPWFQNNISQALDTSFSENLLVTVDFASDLRCWFWNAVTAESAGGAGDAVAASTGTSWFTPQLKDVHLMCKFLVFPTDLHSYLLKNQFQNGPMVQVCYDYEQEPVVSKTLVDNDTNEVSQNLTKRGVVDGFFIHVEDTTTAAGGPDYSKNQFECKALDKFTMRVNGQNVLSLTGKELECFQPEYHGTLGGSYCPDVVCRSYYLPMSVVSKQLPGIVFNGGISLKELGNIEFVYEIHTGTAKLNKHNKQLIQIRPGYTGARTYTPVDFSSGTATYKITVVERVVKLVSVDPGNGNIVVSATQ